MINSLCGTTGLLLCLGPVFQAFLAVVIGFIAAYVAWRNYQNAHTKNRLDLFDKRFAVYDAVLESAHLAMGSSADNNTWHQVSATFGRAINSARFLFPDPVIANELSRMRPKFVKLAVIENQYDQVMKNGAKANSPSLSKREEELFTEIELLSEELWEFCDQLHSLFESHLRVPSGY